MTQMRIGHLSLHYVRLSSALPTPWASCSLRFQRFALAFRLVPTFTLTSDFLVNRRE